MKCVCLGTSAFTKALAQGVLESENELVAIISLPKELLPNNSIDLESFAKECKVAYYEVENINTSGELLKHLGVEVLISSWPKIIKPHILSIPKIAIGTHPTQLPKNRGRHPLHWLKVLGIKSSALSFFQLTPQIDGGDLYLQLPYSITPKDTINTLNSKIEALAKEGIAQILIQNLTPKKQEGEANYWRARNVFDVLLDMRLSSNLIINTIKSFCPPYPCAKIVIEEEIIDIKEARIVESGEKIQNLEHGKIVHKGSDSIVVKCEDALVELVANSSGAFSKIALGGGIISTHPTIISANTKFLCKTQLPKTRVSYVLP